jgi:NADH:ubiquinone oxidoreductase subunit 6 (subunit J)
MLAYQILALIALVSAFMVVTRRNPMHSALWLGHLLRIGGNLSAAQREFIAAIQIIYAGGIRCMFRYSLC